MTYRSESFHDIEPKLAVVKPLSYLCGKIRVSGRMYES
jgi:hypothetical protein